MAALRPPLRGELPGRRGPDGAVARCSSAPNPTRSTTARTPAPPSSTERIGLGTALMAALPDGSAHARRPSTSRWSTRRCRPGRVHPGDERHLAGAFQDNRVIPFEGVRVADMPAAAQDLVLAIAEQFVLLLPAGPAGGPACGRSEEHLRRDLVQLDRRPPTRGRLLLPHPVPGDHRRTRPPLRRLPRLRHPAAVPHPHRAAHPARQRLRPRLGAPVAPAPVVVPSTRAADRGCRTGGRVVG